MKPLLAHVYEPHRVTYPCYVQPKLNGVRALYQNGYFQSRDELPFPEGLLDHLAKPLLQTFDSSVILDGELYVHGWPLQKILGAITPVRQQPTEDTLKVEYHVFDVANYSKSFEERHVWTNNGCQPGPIHRVASYLAANSDEADRFYAQFVASGYEGMMYRLGDCPYTFPKQEFQGQQIGLVKPRLKFLSDQDNRCWHLLKRKDWHDAEFTFLSINETVGDKGEPGFQMWVEGGPFNSPRFKVSSGLSRSEVANYIANPPIGRLVKIKYLVLSSDSIPLNATILAIL